MSGHRQKNGERVRLYWPVNLTIPKQRLSKIFWGNTIPMAMDISKFDKYSVTEGIITLLGTVKLRPFMIHPCFNVILIFCVCDHRAHHRIVNTIRGNGSWRDGPTFCKWGVAYNLHMKRSDRNDSGLPRFAREINREKLLGCRPAIWDAVL